jgi:hypothetical protein
MVVGNFVGTFGSQIGKFRGHFASSALVFKSFEILDSRH